MGNILLLHECSVMIDAFAYTFESGILTEEDDAAIDVSLNFRFPGLFRSITISSTPASNKWQLPKYS
jgi:hypothetical protein